MAEKKAEADVKKPRWWEQWKKAVEVDDTMVSVDGAARFIARSIMSHHTSGCVSCMGSDWPACVW